MSEAETGGNNFDNIANSINQFTTFDINKRELYERIIKSIYYLSNEDIECIKKYVENNHKIKEYTRIDQSRELI